ncbi:radical SAM/SPASM domain-containing protein [Winogradskya humida]|uniref:Radical SAM/SPASM domain-containing protein n=1 Tax=Winogradskya humida TaxID=113566 RepID=A0ABQ3ZJP5_9ACTN|nr:radical SAM/SPASM domain-containing protein [Actinoplanes humidus]
MVGRNAFRHPSGRVVRPVLNTATAKVYLVDLATAQRLEGGVAEGDDARLFGAGLLVRTGHDEAAEVIEASRVAARDRRTRDFVVMPSAYCNMGCGYCGQTHERVTVSRDHRAALAERVARAARGGRYDALNVRWFGGEPLMGYAVLLDLSRRFTAAADEAGVGYAAKIVTNGALLDARKLRALHREARISSVEVTLDGPAEVHDASRPLKSGAGSFQKIVGVIGAALQDPELAGLLFTVRTNIGVHNAALAEPFAAGLAAAGLAHDRVACYPAPVHSWGNDVSDVAVPRAELAAAEMAWFLAYQRHGLRFRLLPAAPRRVVCAATTRHSEVVGADGRVYSCTEQSLVPGHHDQDLGHVVSLDADALRPPGAFDDWYDTLDAGATACRGCAILPVCGGACPKLWREGKPPCPSLRDNVRDRLDLYALTAGYTPVA